MKTTTVEFFLETINIISEEMQDSRRITPDCPAFYKEEIMTERKDQMKELTDCAR